MSASLESLQVLYLLIPMLFVAFIKTLSTTNRDKGPYPPGPKPKPLIGNLLDIPINRGSERYANWGKEFNSDVVFVTALGNHVLAINKKEDAIELLQRRAAIYSGRPQLHILNLMGWIPAMVPMKQYGDDWRLHRRLMQQDFNVAAARKYRLVTSKSVYQMLKGFLETPENFEHHNKMMITSLTMMTMYGYEVKSIHDPFIEAAEKSLAIGATLLTPIGSLINVLPFLRHVPPWFPLAFSRRQADEVKRLSGLMQKIPMDFAKEQFRNGTAPPSFVSEFFERKSTVGTSEEEEAAVHNIAFTVYGAAGDTTTSATATFLYQMAMNPEIVKRAQEEIDLVVGSSRLPTFEDREHLPYIEAIYREVLRWMPSLPLGVPHYTTEDDHYRGYFIPKGTTVFANISAMTHDENVYPDPFTFKPERFFDSKGALNSDDEPIAFGFGRRICVGKHIASSTLWLVVATVLACFEFQKAKDESGNDIEINHEYLDHGFLVKKAPYKCSIVPRTPIVAELIEEGI